MKNLVLIIMFLIGNVGYSQCVTGTPPTLTCGTPISVASDTPSGVYGSASTGNPSCAIAGDKITDGDLYAVEYQVGKVITVDMCLTIGNYVSLLSSDGCTELACENYGTSFNLDNTACNGNRTTTISMDDLGLIVGTIYYIKVQSVANCGGSPCTSASIGGRSYTIECKILLANSCSNGVVMSGNQSYNICNNGSADNSSNPNSEGLVCGYSIENNLMYKWCTDASNTPVSVDIQNMSIKAGSSVQFSILSNNCNGTYTSIQCNSGLSTDQIILITGTAANTCYWIAFDGNAGSTFCADITLIDAAPLPIELVKFDCKLVNNDKINLSWTTASEINNDYFKIDHSIDGENWTNLSIVNGAGNSSQYQYYNMTHNNPKIGYNHYRLTQVDFDGKYESFNVVTCSKELNKLIKEVIYYNSLGQIINRPLYGFFIRYTKYMDSTISVEKVFQQKN